MKRDYRRHVRRTWVDTHSQNVRTDPDIYLPGEAAPKERADNDDDDDNNDDGDGEGELADVTAGVKRKARSWTSRGVPCKVAKATAQGGHSTADMGAIDNRQPDLTLIDTAVGEDMPANPYGRHGYLYIKVKVAVNKKPNPQEAVSLLFHGFPCY